MARQVMEKCDVDSDIQLFIREKGLGSTRPGEYNEIMNPYLV